MGKTHPHFIKLPLADLRLRKELGVTVLLIKRANGTFEKFPGAETKIMKGDWMYFGVPQGEGFSNAVDGLEVRLRGDATVATTRSSGSADMIVAASMSSSSVGRFRSLSEKDVVQSGMLVEFTAEFD